MRTLRDPGLYVIGAAMLCGLANAPAWAAVPAAAVGLQALSLPKYLALWDRAQVAGAGHVWWRTLSMSVALAVGIAGGAFVMGRVVALAWGVP